MPRTSPKPRCPSEVAATRASRLLVGGRLIAKGTASFTIADAFAAVEVSGEVEAGVGELVIVELVREAGKLVLKRLVERGHGSSGEGRGDAGRLIARGIGKNLRARAAAFQRVRQFFAGRGFTEVDTPLLVPSPGLDLHLDAVDAGGGWLITSPEYQMKRLLVGGLPRIFQIGHVFRKGELGARHNPEFTMLEWYRAFSDIDEVMADTEELVLDVALALTGGRSVPGPAGPIEITPPFERLPVADAFEKYAGVTADQALSMSERDEEGFFRLLVDQVEPALGRAARPVFLVDYPVAQASLARKKPSNPRVCERFELYLGGVELCNGFGELTDPVEQRVRFIRDQQARARHHKTVYPMDERFLSALEEGMPPSAGNALGLDRLIAACLGEAEIASVMPFPARYL
jgi:elongation factor P--(R)-beta-lysine ligase